MHITPFDSREVFPSMNKVFSDAYAKYVLKSSVNAFVIEVAVVKQNTN